VAAHVAQHELMDAVEYRAMRRVSVPGRRRGKLLNVVNYV